MPKFNVITERFRFRKREQFPDESVDNYIAALHQLVITCDFKTMKDEIICDQFTEKTIHHRIREELLLETYSLDQTIESSRQMENGMKEVKLLSADNIDREE